MASGLRFGVQAALANGWDSARVIELIKDTHHFEVSADDFQTIIDSPEKVIAAKSDVSNIEHQNNYLEGIIRIYAMTDGEEEGYQLNPRAYVLSLMLIEDAIKEITNPVSEIANDYAPLKDVYSKLAEDRTLDSQFSKYQLFQLTDGVELGASAPPRLYDSTNDFTVFVCGSDDRVFEYLRQLRRKCEFELALKPSSLYFVSGNPRISRIAEHLETGLYFSNVNLDDSLITKLYDDSYDTLWINVFGNSITFEEFQNEFQIYGEYIVTQVLHCEYFKELDKYFISHCDHEFIFYDIKEYNSRQTNAWQKGNARKRVKTFKIDNGKIPMYPGTNVLLDFLEMKFQNRALVREYFEKVRNEL